MYKNLTISSILGALAVILGAFGAHALKNKLSVEALNSFEVGVVSIEQNQNRYELPPGIIR
ncbi:hypothetical protein V2742_06060, partial [Tenacibaculum maritimum]